MPGTPSRGTHTISTDPASLRTHPGGRSSITSRPRPGQGTPPSVHPPTVRADRPRAEGWFAEDLDRLPQAPRHTELIDGALVFVMFPQRSWHSRAVTALTAVLEELVPDGLLAEREMTIKLDRRNRPEPDLVVAEVDYDPDRTWSSSRTAPGRPTSSPGSSASGWSGRCRSPSTSTWTGSCPPARGRSGRIEAKV
ncbi:Uma2 family endonuclease [Kitasatospora purpeofusca]|uniref:Uma2 family endonuclease n=1 Tax=Kitasatospora purpeofusca TaxID=67352 RepID=UPI0039A6AB0C